MPTSRPLSGFCNPNNPSHFLTLDFRPHAKSLKQSDLFTLRRNIGGYILQKRTPGETLHEQRSAWVPK